MSVKLLRRQTIRNISWKIATAKDQESRDFNDFYLASQNCLELESTGSGRTKKMEMKVIQVIFFPFSLTLFLVYKGSEDLQGTISPKICLGSRSIKIFRPMLWRNKNPKHFKSLNRFRFGSEFFFFFKFWQQLSFFCPDHFDCSLRRVFFSNQQVLLFDPNLWTVLSGFESWLHRRVQISAQTMTLLFRSELVRLFPAGCHATAITLESCSRRHVSGLDGLLTFQMKTVPSLEPTQTYSESGLNTALSQKSKSVKTNSTAWTWF